MTPTLRAQLRKRLLDLEKRIARNAEDEGTIEILLARRDRLREILSG